MKSRHAIIPIMHNCFDFFEDSNRLAMTLQRALSKPGSDWKPRLPSLNCSSPHSSLWVWSSSVVVFPEPADVPGFTVLLRVDKASNCVSIETFPRHSRPTTRKHLNLPHKSLRSFLHPRLIKGRFKRLCSWSNWDFVVEIELGANLDRSFFSSLSSRKMT